MNKIKRYTWMMISLFIVALLFLSIAFHANYRPFYQSFYKSNDTAATLGMSEIDLLEANDVLLDYIFFMRDDLDVLVSVNNQLVPMYNQREIDHMVDVKVLFGWMLAAMSLLLLGMAGWVLALYKNDKKTWLSQLQNHTKIAFSFLSFFFGFILFFAIIDFQSFWTSFHLVFFRNDLWLLNPATDRLIVMVPESFFILMISRIVLTWFGLVALFVLTNWWLVKKEQKG